MENDLIAASHNWADARDAVMIIDLAEFEAAHNDPEWLAFCHRADRYLAVMSADIQPNKGTGTELG